MQNIENNLTSNNQNTDGPQTQISRSGYSLTLNICEMAADTTIVTMQGE